GNEDAVMAAGKIGEAITGETEKPLVRVENRAVGREADETKGFVENVYISIFFYKFTKTKIHDPAQSLFEVAFWNISELCKFD
ncbi:MAG TPA: hypothetical protein PLX84_13410, partial [Acidiphilium sp.]|nr:hypothetical protein [Acidiphilium sp.]